MRNVRRQNWKDCPRCAGFGCYMCIERVPFIRITDEMREAMKESEEAARMRIAVAKVIAENPMILRCMVL